MMQPNSYLQVCGTVREQDHPQFLGAIVSVSCTACVHLATESTYDLFLA